MGMHFPSILIVCFLHTSNGASLEGVPFFDQLVDAFRIRSLGSGQSLEVSRSTGWNCAFSAQGRIRSLRAANRDSLHAGRTCLR